MAAILCKSIGDLCNASCDVLSQVICLPCKACGMTWDFVINDLVCTPFMPYSVVTFGLHTPALVYLIKSFDNASCPELFSWLLINAILSGCHIIAAMYIVNRIREENSDPKQQHMSTTTTTSSKESYPTKIATTAAVTGVSTSSVTGTDDNYNNKMEQGQSSTVPTAIATPYYTLSNFSPTTVNHRNAISDNDVDVVDDGQAYSFKRMKHVLCYDKGFALYIIVIVIWVVWLGLGVTRRFTFDDGNEVCDELVSYLNITIMCGYLWATLVAFAFCCSLLCLR